MGLERRWRLFRLLLDCRDWPLLGCLLIGLPRILDLDGTEDPFFLFLYVPGHLVKKSNKID